MPPIPTIPSVPVLAAHPLLAIGVRPEASPVNVLVAVTLLGLAGWFLVIAHDVATDFRRFRAGDEEPARRRRAQDGADPASAEEPGGRRGPRRRTDR